MLDLEAEVTYAQTGEERHLPYVTGSMILRDFKDVGKDGKPVNEIPRRVDVVHRPIRRCSPGNCTSKADHKSPRVTAVRNSAGEINLAKLMVATEAKN